MKIIRFSIFFSSIFLSLILYSCSSSEETTNKNTGDDGVYVFDEIPDNSKVDKKDNTFKEMRYVYLIQIGAFVSKLNAEDFTAKSEQLLGEKLDVTFDESDKLYIVRYRRAFNSRNEAEKIRNELWQTEQFKDAWIIEKPK